MMNFARLGTVNIYVKIHFRLFTIVELIRYICDFKRNGICATADNLDTVAIHLIVCIDSEIGFSMILLSIRICNYAILNTRTQNACRRKRAGRHGCRQRTLKFCRRVPHICQCTRWQDNVQHH